MCCPNFLIHLNNNVKQFCNIFLVVRTAYCISCINFIRKYFNFLSSRIWISTNNYEYRESEEKWLLLQDGWWDQQRGCRLCIQRPEGRASFWKFKKKNDFLIIYYFIWYMILTKEMHYFWITFIKVKLSNCLLWLFHKIVLSSFIRLSEVCWIHILPCTDTVFKMIFVHHTISWSLWRLDFKHLWLICKSQVFLLLR